MSLKRPACLCLAIALAGCVAPEAPPAPRISPSAANKPAISTSGYEDAPVANRKLGAPTSDSLIRIGH